MKTDNWPLPNWQLNRASLKSVESREICGTIPEGFSQISIPPEVKSVDDDMKSVDDDMKSVERHEICGAT